MIKCFIRLAESNFLPDHLYICTYYSGIDIRRKGAAGNLGKYSADSKRKID